MCVGFACFVIFVCCFVLWFVSTFFYCCAFWCGIGVSIRFCLVCGASVRGWFLLSLCFLLILDRSRSHPAIPFFYFIIASSFLLRSSTLFFLRRCASLCLTSFFFFFFTALPPTEIYTLSLLSALPIFSIKHRPTVVSRMPSSAYPPPAVSRRST